MTILPSPFLVLISILLAYLDSCFYLIMNMTHLTLRYCLPVMLLVLLICSCSMQKKTMQADTAQSLPELDPQRYNVGLLMLPGTYNTELTAPMDIFQHTQYREGIKAMNVFTISNTLQLIKTFEGLWVKPDYNYLNKTPQIDILVIPAAENNIDTDLEDEQLIKFIQEASATATWVMSHCDGAFLLAQAGLLDDKWSTTFPGDLDLYKEKYPHLKVKEELLFVHDGRFITSAGGAKSFEASLYLCELLYGKDVAKKLARGLVIDWNLSELKYFSN